MHVMKLSEAEKILWCECFIKVATSRAGRDCITVSGDVETLALQVADEMIKGLRLRSEGS